MSLDRVSTAILIIVLAALVAGAFVHPAVGEDRSKTEPISALIDKLPEIAEGDIGYTPTMTGSGFLPLESPRMGMGLLGQKPPVSSGVIRELVKHGAEAVPELIAHLDDKRKTKIEIKHDGAFGGIFFNDEYDYNRRTAKSAPPDVNRDRFGGRDDPHEHTVTVGDLCFVALGQIVNRHFNSVRYQPTACIMINSPTHSEKLRRTIKAEWGQLMGDLHKELLKQDFLQPDFEDRRVGACLRLGYYYPDSLEPLALVQLGTPRFDVFQVSALVRDQLYRAKSAAERNRLLETFVAKHGEASRQGILDDLFDDLDTQEADEEKRLSPPLKEKYAARACLIELFGYPKEVKSADRPHLVLTDDTVQARFIDAIALFPTPKIDVAVREILHGTEDDYLARACVRYLIGRSADADIKKYVDPRLKGADAARRKELDRMVDMLGWTPLHVAIEMYACERAEKLIGNGADVNARAANGKTPLHVAAESGSYGGLQLLLDHKANLNLRDEKGRTPIQLGIGYEPAVEILVAAGADAPDILVAAHVGRTDLVKGFLKRDKSLVAAKTSRSVTPLHLAAEHGHIAIVEALIAGGADVNAIDSSKLTPLHLAAMNGHADIVSLLLSNKADRNAKSWDGKTALEYAKAGRNEQMIELLKKK